MGLAPMPQGVPGGGLPPPPPGGGGMPPGMQAPPGNLGPHTIPQSNPGNVMQAMQKLAAASKMIGEALPQIPMGEEIHGKVMKVYTEMTKILGEAKDQMMQIQTLMQQIKAAQQEHAGAGGLQQAMPPGGPGGAPPPPGGPAMPPPGAPA